MKKYISVKVNGKMHKVQVSPRTRLVDLIREDLDLKGTKYGCGEGECGACTVILNGMIINSCLFLAIEADGAEIITIEGLSPGEEIHPLQQAFIDEGAAQCGFCSPGMILAAEVLLSENPQPSEEEIKEALAGNFCRCTGYSSILRAVQAVARGRVAK